MAEPSGWLQKLDFNRWWKVAIAVGVVIALASLPAKDHGIFLVGIGISACGFGEWMNHRMEMEIKFGGKLTTFERKNRPMGLVLDGLGILLFAVGVYRIVTS